MIDILKSQNAMVSGMSVAEAAAALGFTKTASGIYVKTLVTTGVESVAGTTASGVAAGATTGATTTASNLVLFEGAGGTAEVGGLGAVALPVALSMGAAVGGYLIGNEIYEHNSEFLDKLMYPIYDFITGNNLADSLYKVDTPDYVPTTPLIFDQNGSAFLDSRLTSKIKSLLDVMAGEIPTSNMGLPNGSPFKGAIERRAITTDQMAPMITVTRNDTSFIYYAAVQSVFPIYVMQHFTKHPTSVKGDSYTTTYCSKNGPFKYLSWNRGIGTTFTWEWLDANPVNVNGVTYWFGFTKPDAQYLDAYTKKLDCIYTDLGYGVSYSYTDLVEAIYGIEISRHGGLPSGVTRYTPGTSPTVPIKFPDEIPDWSPVAIPDAPTVPGTMPAPKVYPDPAPNPEKITPHINPVQPQPINVPIKKPGPDYVPTIPIIPVPDPTPNTSTTPQPSPDPNSDPSQATKPQPSTPEVPAKLPDPIDKGTTPKPLLPVVPPIASSAAGLLHVYNPTNEQLNSFGSWLWTTFSGDLIDTISKLFNNPMDAVIGLHEIYCTPIRTGESTIKAGFLDSGVASQLVGTRYTEIHCGALSVPEYWNNYLDYAPYTKTYCYLPFIGIVELNTDDIVGSGVEITYKIDTYNVSCIALITTAKAGSTESVTYEFSGNCAVEIPITSGMKSAMQSALLGAATMALAAGTGGGAVLGAATLGGARAGASSKNLVQHSGSFGSSYGAMGIKTPFIIVKRPKQKVVPGYNENYGYPAHKMVHIADCHGYLKAIEVDVVSSTATEDEKKLIQQLLKTGIFVN